MPIESSLQELTSIAAKTSDVFTSPLNQILAWIGAIGAILSSVAAVISAWLSYKAAEEARRNVNLSTQPRLVSEGAKMENAGGTRCLLIKNIGGGAAQEITANVDGKTIEESSIGTRYLMPLKDTPEQRIKIPIDNINNKKECGSYLVSIKYSGLDDEKFETIIKIKPAHSDKTAASMGFWQFESEKVKRLK